MHACIFSAGVRPTSGPVFVRHVPVRTADSAHSVREPRHTSGQPGQRERDTPLPVQGGFPLPRAGAGADGVVLAAAEGRATVGGGHSRGGQQGTVPSAAGRDQDLQPGTGGRGIGSHLH